MKTVKVTTDDRISIVDVDFDDFRSIQKAIGGHFETVRTDRTGRRGSRKRTDGEGLQIFEGGIKEWKECWWDM